MVEFKEQRTESKSWCGKKKRKKKKPSTQLCQSEEENIIKKRKIVRWSDAFVG